MDILDKMDMLLTEKEEDKWSAEVDTKYHPKHEAIKKALKKDDVEESANDIIAALDKDDASPETLVKRITFFENRAGRNLSIEDKRKLDAAKKKAKKKEFKNKGTVATLKKKKSKLTEDAVPMQNNNGQQNTNQPQVDVNGAANSVMSVVMSKTQDATTAISIINQALALIKQKFNIQ